MDEAALLKSARKTGRVLTAEEHTVLGCAVAEVLGSLTLARLDYVELRDCFAECGPYVKLLARYGISTDEIMSRVQRLVQGASA